jgi:hypothetical protein
MEGGKTELPMMALLWLKLILILATPYFFAGMAISLALTRSPWPVSLVYGVDLIGAAAGCLVVLAVLILMDAVSALFLVGAFGALAAVFFSTRAVRRPSRSAVSGGGAPADFRTARRACRRLRVARAGERGDPAIWA